MVYIRSCSMQQTLGKPWRAMILKDNDGDVGIALASWEGAVAGKPGVKGVPGIQLKANQMARQECEHFPPKVGAGNRLEWRGLRE